jgi:hypothetical protein
MKIAWSGLADKDYWNYIAQYCVPTWKKLQGDKYIVHDSDLINLDYINNVSWNDVANYDCQWIKVHNNKKAKTNNFWRKMQSQAWAVRNLKDYDFVILLDTDIEILDFNNELFNSELKIFLESDLIWATGRSNSRLHDSGFIVFNMHHPELNNLIDYYENIWESGSIFNLKKSYDGHAVESMFDIFPSYKIMNTDYGKGFHVYDIGMVHYGSKLPKQLRKEFSGPGQELVNNYIKDKVIKKYKDLI